MNKDNRYQQVDGCLLEDMDGELLLFNPQNSTTLHLNGPSTLVWGLCDGEHSVAQMIADLQEAFPNQSQEIEADVVGVIKDLVDHEVLILVPH